MNMMARKTRIAIITVAISLLVITIIGILTFLYLETDAFKTNETLFTKYLAQNFEELDNLKNNSNSTTKSLLENSKYTSKIDGQIEYIENKDTSDENKNSSVNNIKLKINVQKDNQNKYKYYDMAIQNENEKLLGVEYIKTQGKQGIRLNGIQQFVSTQNEENEILKEFNIKTIDKLTSSIDIDSIISFSEEEKQTINLVSVKTAVCITVFAIAELTVLFGFDINALNESVACLEKSIYSSILLAIFA